MAGKTCVAPYVLNLIAFAPPIAARLDILDEDEDHRWRYGSEFDIDFRYTRGRPSVLPQSFEVGINRAEGVPEDGNPLPTFVAVTPAIPDISGGPNEWKYGRVTLRGPLNPDPSGSPSGDPEMNPLNYVVTISFFQPEEELAYANLTYVTGESPIVASYQESENTIDVTATIPSGALTDTDGNDIDAEIEYKVDLIDKDGLTHEKVWAALDEVRIDHDFVESVTHSDVEPEDTLEVNVFIRTAIDTTISGFTAIRNRIESLFGGGTITGNKFNFGGLQFQRVFPPHKFGPGLQARITEPRNLRVTYSGTQLIFEWDRPEYVGLSPINRYEYQITTTNLFLGDWLSNNRADRFVVNDPEVALYKFRVRAVNGVGQRGPVAEITYNLLT